MLEAALHDANTPFRQAWVASRNIRSLSRRKIRFEIKRGKNLITILLNVGE